MKTFVSLRLSLFLSFAAAPFASAAPHLGAAESEGTPQHITSPDQVPEGLAKSDWANIRAAYEARRHSFQPVVGGWQARNPGQQWVTMFDGRGFVTRPTNGDWQWGLELKSYGFPGKEHTVSDVPTVKAAGQRLTYQWDAVVQEWFVNDPCGLEHGFTVSERPQEIDKRLTASNDPLSFTLGVRGNLRPAITADAQSVRFFDDHGVTIITYGELKVWDADGKPLPSRFAAAEAGLRLLVDERGAGYPLTIDPIAQQAYLKASNTGVGDGFGYAVAIAGDTVVVGAPNEDSSTTGVNSTPNELAADSGAAYVFTRSGTTWTQQAYLKASNSGAGDWFGISVAISEDSVVVGAYNEDSSTTGVNSTPNDSSPNSGAAYVFTRSGTTWSQQAYLKASNTGANDQFSNTVAISGDTVVVGARGEDSSTTGVNSAPNESGYESGAAYVFTRSGTTWSQQAYLKASNTGASDWFGFWVAVSGDTVVVGALYEDSSTTGVNSMPNDNSISSGGAYVYTRSGTTWTQQAYLKASNTGESDWFGYSVAISGNTVVVGAAGEASSSIGVNSTSNDLAAVAGAAYVFTRSGTTWTQQAYLKAGNTGTNDYFGERVAISGDTVVIGASNEDSSTTGVNSTPNELAADSGAAYVFTRSGTTWTQQAYLKASNPGENDWFGAAVAVSGDTVVIGARQENSSTTGVNSTPNDSSTNSGAAYVFSSLGSSTMPVISAPTSANVTTTSATLGGNVTSDGGATISVRGVVLALSTTNSNPQIGGTGVTNITGPGTTGVFTVGVSSLTPGMAYTFAAYATNSVGTSYSTSGNFTTNPVSVAPQFTSSAPTSTGMVGTAYNHTCTASGTATITFTISSGSLPTGLTLSTSGVISGTPSATGSFSGTITAANGTLPDATQNFSINIGAYHTLTVGGTHGSVSGGGSYPHDATATITATRNPGYLFTNWSGDATGTTNPLSVLMNADKTITANFTPDTNDNDNDGLTNYQEIVEYYCNPEVKDTDGDGFDDGYEVNLGFSPTDSASTPEAQMVIYTAVEVRFGAAQGQAYRIESSTDLQNWTLVEGSITGTGNTVTRFYSIKDIPKRFYRAVRE